jgi:hypothetical protein
MSDERRTLLLTRSAKLSPSRPLMAVVTAEKRWKFQQRPKTPKLIRAFNINDL